MNVEHRKVAIYSRKSKYTGKGESIGNQIELCRDYLRMHMGEEAAANAIVFEDEGFSGGNLDRLLTDTRHGVSFPFPAENYQT